jgi:hypothetical protein
VQAPVTSVNWTIKARQFVNCNCAYGCPCQFNALPTHGACVGFGALDVVEGHHGDIRLDGLKAVLINAFPGPVHEGRGVSARIIDKRATPLQRDALARIMAGEDALPGGSIFQILASMVETVHRPVFADIDLAIDVDRRRARLMIPGLIEARGEPIRNPVTGEEFRARIELPNGFEFTVAELGRGWSKANGPIRLDLADSYGQFANLHITESGVVR